jgi:hypothetical protein
MRTTPKGWHSAMAVSLATKIDAKPYLKAVYVTSMLRGAFAGREALETRGFLDFTTVVDRSWRLEIVRKPYKTKGVRATA